MLNILIGMLIWQTITMIMYFVTKENEEIGLYWGFGIWFFVVGYVVAPLVRKIKRILKKVLTNS